MGRANKKNKSKVEEQVEVEDPEGAKASHKRKNVSPSSSPGAQRHKFQDKSQVEEIKKAAKTIEEIKKQKKYPIRTKLIIYQQLLMKKLILRLKEERNLHLLKFLIQMYL